MNGFHGRTQPERVTALWTHRADRARIPEYSSSNSGAKAVVVEGLEFLDGGLEADFAGAEFLFEVCNAEHAFLEVEGGFSMGRPCSMSSKNTKR